MEKDDLKQLLRHHFTFSVDFVPCPGAINEAVVIENLQQALNCVRVATIARSFTQQVVVSLIT